MDATYIQRYLVGYETFNSSQLYVSPEDYIDDISVMNATTIQKRCTESKEYYSRNLRILLEEVERSNPESEDFMFDSIKYPRPGDKSLALREIPPPARPSGWKACRHPGDKSAQQALPCGLRLPQSW